MQRTFARERFDHRLKTMVPFTPLEHAIDLQRGLVVSTPIKPTDRNEWICEDCGHEVGEHVRQMGGGFRCPTKIEMQRERLHRQCNAPND